MRYGITISILFALMITSCMVETDRPSGRELLNLTETPDTELDTIKPPDTRKDNVEVEKDSMDTFFPKDNAL